MRHALAAVALLLGAAMAHAIDPATVKGTLTLGNERIALTHMATVQRDNAEGLLDWPSEMRMVLADREVKPEQLWGVAFLPAANLATQGRMRGVLLRWNPADPTGVQVTLLHKPSEPGRSLATTSISSTGGALPEVRVAANRVTGKVAGEAAGAAYAAQFSAPLWKEPAVTADLKGDAARNSPQLKTLQAIQQGLAKGDWGVQRSLSTEAASRAFDARMAAAGLTDPAQLKAIAAEAAGQMGADLNQAARVVVRERRAIVLLGKGAWHQMALDGDTWKLDE